jgi:hypothetical protein
MYAMFQSEKEELGPGSGPQSKPELGAKDDTGDRPQDDKQQQGKDDKDDSLPQPLCLDEVGILNRF